MPTDYARVINDDRLIVLIYLYESIFLINIFVLNFQTRSVITFTFRD